MSSVGVIIAFWVFAVVTIGGALMVVASRNLLHAVLWLILSFIGVAGLFLTLSADFVAVAQVLVYAGAIGVLAIFAIMLTPEASRTNSETALFLPSALLAILVFGIIAVAILDTTWPVQVRTGFAATAAAIGNQTLTHYTLPFEIVSVVLLVAMIGAIVLVRGVDARTKLPPESGANGSETQAEREAVTNR